LYGRARGFVLLTHFLGAGREPPRFGGKLKNLLGGLDALFGFENTQEIEGAEFNDPFAVAHDDSPENCRFFAQQQTALVPEQAVGFLDDLDGGALA